mgnify:CR=1 FL=1
MRTALCLFAFAIPVVQTLAQEPPHAAAVDVTVQPKNWVVNYTPRSVSIDFVKTPDGFTANVKFTDYPAGSFRPSRSPGVKYDNCPVVVNGDIWRLSKETTFTGYAMGWFLVTGSQMVSITGKGPNINTINVARKELWGDDGRDEVGVKCKVYTDFFKTDGAGANVLDADAQIVQSGVRRGGVVSMQSAGLTAHVKTDLATTLTADVHVTGDDAAIARSESVAALNDAGTEVELAGLRDMLTRVPEKVGRVVWSGGQSTQGKFVPNPFLAP